MENKINMTLRIEPTLKKEASELFKSLGLDLSTATGLFYRQALRCHGLPFAVRLDDQSFQDMVADKEPQYSSNSNNKLSDDNK